MSRVGAFKTIKSRARQAALPAEICAHSIRGTGSPNTLRTVTSRSRARIAGHESTRTTQLYNRLHEGDLARRQRADPNLSTFDDGRTTQA